MKIFSLWGEIALKGVEKVKQDIEETTDQAEDSGSKMESAFKKIGAAVATYLTVDTIVQFGKALVDASAEVSAEVSAFEQIMGEYSDNAQDKMKEVADTTGTVSSRLTPYMTSLTAKFKGLGYDIDEATTLASDGLMLASDAAAFWDKSLEESMSGLNSFINGSYEGGEAIGLFANDTQMAAYAVEKGIVSETKAWSALDEATKQATRLEYAKAMFEQSGATGQAAKEADQYANVQANLTEKWRQFKATIGEPVLQNIVIPAMQTLSGWVDGLSKGYETLTTWINENKTAVTLIGIAIGTLTAAIIAYNIQQNAATIALKLHAAATTIATTATTAWGAVMAFVTSPIALVVAAIGALIAIVYLLVKNWDTVKEKTQEVWAKVVDIFESVKTRISNIFEGIKSVAINVWNGIKSAIIAPISEASTTVKNVIDRIRSFFNFSWSLPKLKMPHVSISGEFSLIPPSVPKFSIQWHKKAMDNPMILDSPTLFGEANGSLLGAGEAGAEVVAGRDTLMNMIRNAASQNNERMEELLEKILSILVMYFPQLMEMYPQIVLDTGVLVGQIAPAVDRELGSIARMKERGR